eukprot:COSAG01_NODE_63833_length_278_cov_1.435754_1_plen_34_part_10
MGTGGGRGLSLTVNISYRCAGLRDTLAHLACRLS